MIDISIHIDKSIMIDAMTDEQIDLVFKALADPVRRRIVEFLHRPDAACCSRGEQVCGCDLEGPLGLAQATISHHMKCLTLANLVIGEKRGRWVYYRLNHLTFRDAATWLGPFGEIAAASATAEPRSRAG
jgi:ArsR family transcriptional regulator